MKHPLMALAGLCVAATACTPESAPVAARKEVRSYTQAEIDKLIRDRTALFNDPTYGRQVEYYGKDRAAYLWFPGSKSVIKGEWVTSPEGREICFMYFSPIYKQETGLDGTVPSCTNIETWEAEMLDSKPGDVFHLSRHKLPRVLEKNASYTTLDEVAKSGKSAKVTSAHTRKK